jgi:hypothetical protein
LALGILRSKEKNMQVKFRSLIDGLRPQRTKMEVPGWGGQSVPRATGEREQPWHCVPFTESARYGIELFYPYANELRVRTKRGKVVLDGDFGPDPQTGVEWPPFRNFGDTYYTYQVLLDLKVEPGFAIRTEPHPRFYTDPTDTVPIAVPALLRNWWPMMFFMVFKSPAEGRTHIFRQGEPFAQIIVLPTDPDIDLIPMPEEEAAERELQARRIQESRATLGQKTQWTSSTNTVFDGTYRHILSAAAVKEKAKLR